MLFAVAGQRQPAEATYQPVLFGGGDEAVAGLPRLCYHLDCQDFVALNGGPHFTFSEAISFFVDCETQQDVDEL